MGDEDEDEGCAVELRITEGGAGAAGGAGRRDGYPGQARRGPCTGWAHSPPVLTANLTGHEEKVSVDNFELLKVLGTGGEDPHWAGVPGTVPWASRLHPRLGLGQATSNAPNPFPAQSAWPAPPCPDRVCMPTPGAGPR